MNIAARLACAGLAIGAASADARGGLPAQPSVRTLAIDYVLPAPRPDVEERARWSIPEPLEAYDAREAPRLRFNGRKVKLRVPIG